MKRRIDVDAYEDPVSGVTRLRLTDTDSGTKLQTSPDALWDLLERVLNGEISEWRTNGNAGSE